MGSLCLRQGWREVYARLVNMGEEGRVAGVGAISDFVNFSNSVT
jgi:hypothetical protein